MRSYFLLAVLFIAVSCNNDDKPIDIVLNEVENGSVIRTLQFNQGEFYVGDTQGEFSVDIEVQDAQNGRLMDRVGVFARFVDNTLTEADFSSEEKALFMLDVSDFQFNGNDGLPRTTLSVSQAELIAALDLPVAEVQCKDQFLLRLEVFLTDGRSFTVGSATSIIIAFDTFFSSPYCYTINVVEPIDQDLFTGIYTYSSIEDGPSGPTFIPEGQVEIFKGHSNNVRYIPLKHNRSHPTNELPRKYHFTIACDESVFGKNQLSSVIGYCANIGAPILLGPDIVNAQIDPEDDSVFELWLVEGYLGWDGGCGFGTAPSKLRFTRQ